MQDILKRLSDPASLNHSKQVGERVSERVSERASSKETEGCAVCCVLKKKGVLSCPRAGGASFA